MRHASTKYSLAGPPEIVIRPPSVSDEWAYMRYVAGKLPFYWANEYAVSLPDHPAFAVLRSEGSRVSAAQWRDLRTAFARDVYRKSDYSAGCARLKSELDLVTRALPYLRDMETRWRFAVLPRYTVVLTLYGVGGSYDARTGRIVIRTTVDGAFRRLHPFQTVLHEMVHIGIEDSLVRPLCLTHAEKERVVDLLCSVALRGVIGQYDVSGRGDARIDAYVTTGSMRSLPTALSHYVADHPRAKKAA